MSKTGEYLWESYAGDDKENAYIKYIKTLGITETTDVTIAGNAFIKGSVYGGSENGYVRQDTHVTIAGDCQIGNGDGINRRYTDGTGGSTNEWAYDGSTNEKSLAECNHWSYISPYAPYDKFTNEKGTDGHTFYGNVFGGGSGYFPYKSGKWNPDAGVVGGNTVVNITGGHILTSIYGGNEMTDVKGSCTVNMEGGTLGVPRTLKQIHDHPVTCYLFGAGKGDQRVLFNTWTNVASTNVTVSGGIIYGSVFGGGEDGHVLGDVTMTIGGSTKIGTWGTSYVDGNIFGGGRGFSGDALTAGSVGGNVTVNITGGTMLGSIYGGGRLASVGTFFVNPESPHYGQLQEDFYIESDDLPDGKSVGDAKDTTHGHIKINISGGSIGNGIEGTEEDKGYFDIAHSGNVFGGSMGRLELLDGTTNPIWPELGQSKTSEVNITGNTTHIYRNVYGGGEFGVVRENTYVTIGGTLVGTTPTIDSPSTAPQIDGSVYGSGHGSDKTEPTLVTVHWKGEGMAAWQDLDYVYTPMQWAGVVGGNTTVSVFGGTVGQNVYGGGELASVGIIDYRASKTGTGDDTGVTGYKYLTVKKHDAQDQDKKTLYDFGLSWPYEFTYVAYKPNSSAVGGLATVKVAGGTVSQYVYGGGKGQVDFNNGGENDITEQRYTEAFCTNVRETQVTIGTEGGSGDTPTIGPGTATSAASVYGGGEDGHVIGDAYVTIHHGTIVHSVFGGGKGLGTYKTTLWKATGTDKEPTHEDLTNQTAYSWTAGRVYGNTTVTMHGGKVGWFIYGGGNLGSVGKGSYTGGIDDYSTGGYGELPSADGAIWTTTPEAGSYAYHFQNSGIATVNLLGGTVGTEDGGNVGGDTYESYQADGLPYGSVFGGSRGKAAASCKRSPRYRYVPNFFLGYVNKTIVNIGGTAANALASGDGPTIHGSLYGGGQDGHVRNSTEVHIYKGNIAGQKPSVDDVGRSGHVFGAGSGIGKFDTGTKDGSGDPIMAVNNSSGSVTCTTLVEVYGDNSDDENNATTKIKGNVYGGGALASVGPPFSGTQKDKNDNIYDECKTTDTPYDEATPRAHGSKSYSQVDIKGGRIVGSVYSASRGPSDSFYDSNSFDGGAYDATKYATDIWSCLNVTGGTILGSVYGGGEGGIVKHDTEVHLDGGSIANDAFGGGKGTKRIAADVGGNTTVELNKKAAQKAETNVYVKGCSVSRIFGCNNFKGTPKGKANVHVYATQHKRTSTIHDKIKKFDKLSNYEVATYSTHSYDGKTLPQLATDAGIDTDDAPYTTYTGLIASGSADEKKQALADLIDFIGESKYDVLAVYGGGNLAPYKPTDALLDKTVAGNLDKINAARSSVIIDGCELTSIKQVYGAGNAAPTPANYLRVNAAYEIGELFGGGNGRDPYQSIDDDKWYENPGANVGYYSYMEYDTSSTDGTSSAAAYKATEKSDADTKEKREAHYSYGSGVATTEIVGGRIHDCYGGSNKQGNIRQTLYSTYQASGTCDMDIDNNYGASKEAEIDGEIVLIMDCVTKGGELYGGAENAVLNNNVTINVTNGTFTNIYGGNNKSGCINGAITINVKESGCTPIFIDNIYGGGNEAAYSIYGFTKDGSVWKARTKADFDTAKAAALSGLDDEATQEDIDDALIAAGLYGFPKRDPQINIISASGIGNIYGGGFQADIEGSAYVNVNMENGMVLKKFVTEKPGDFTVGKTYTVDGKPYKYTVERIDNGNAILAIGPIGNIYGAGELGSIHGDTYVEIGTGKHHTSDGVEETITPARNAAKITGNVFGGGKGQALASGDDAFMCATAMVGEVDSGEGSASVTIGNGTIDGSVYGGGEIGRVEKNTQVTIGIEGDTTNEPIVGGSVFGAGKGVSTHGYSALVRGNSTVTIQGKTKVGGSVYGGGEIASVGRYTLVDGRPTSLMNPNSGNCVVIVRDDAEIGPDDMKMFHVNESGIIVANDKPDNTGHVFGGGKGAMPYIGVDGNPWSEPWSINKDNEKDTYNVASYSTDENPAAKAEAEYLKFIETLALATQTDVTIGGNAFVKGDVFGGSEQGFVQHDTHVTIKDNCQIGNGYVQMDDNGKYLDELASPVTPIAVNRRYTADEWADRQLKTTEDDPLELRNLANTYYKNSLPECASWKYEAPYAPHDVFADKYESKGGALVATNGSTFYGNVFGGGSGYFPYAPGKWHWKAGDVGGNTIVDIKGGHILTNVYGANELTNVSGKSTINMSGGTIGVPRTLGQIAAHPVTCYLFGGGKGDPRVLFNKQTNVQDVEVNISGGWIYGSVFGGGEDGHVMRDVKMTISERTVETPTYADYYAGRATKIGTWGTSYVDGNVFGGGRGFSGDAYTAGNVAGSINLTISGGTMLGSVYGGGRLGSVGYDLKASNEGGYGEMSTDANRGHVEINISGGTIGNDYEYKYVPTDVADLATWQTANHVPQTTYESTTDTSTEPDTYTYRLLHTRGGNVYAGGMGRREKLGSSTDPITVVDWRKLGNVKSTKLTITGGTIKSNVYGGGEYGAVRGNHMVDGVALSTEVNITGGTIGTEIKDDASKVMYTFGSVFGGGTGTVSDVNATTAVADADKLGAYVTDNTKVTVNDAVVRGSVYGGGELSAVGGSTDVIISGATEIGRNEVKPKTDSDPGYVMFGGWSMGNVYGGGRGHETSAVAGLVKGNTNVLIQNETADAAYAAAHAGVKEGDIISSPKVYHNVYGGGALGSVGSFFVSRASDGGAAPENIPAGVPYWTVGQGGTTGANNTTTNTGMATVTIKGGTIGISGRDNGMVFGSSRGDISAPTVLEGSPAGTQPMDQNNRLAWVRATAVTIGTEGGNRKTPLVRGSVYGGGENGHNYQNATVNILSGTIGIPDINPATGEAEEWWDFGAEGRTADQTAALNTEYRAYRGNVYGAGDGFDTYTLGGKKHHNPRAGMVGGSTVVNIKGGHIGRSVYGAGAMASMGNIINARDTLDVSRGGTGNAKHLSETNGFALSWPYKFEFAPMTGKCTVNVTGGHIGTLNVDGGDVYGSARGEAGDRYEMAHFAYANETEVNIDYKEPYEVPEGQDMVTNIANNYDTQCITGSVHGSGENGYVYGDTHVTLNKGLIGHSLYGAGKGKGTYTKSLNKIGGDGTYEAKIYSLIAGKVFGNTYVTMNGGHVGRNVYGGGNMGSVGKGNYAAGSDDYYPAGYGETLDGASEAADRTLWDGGNANSLAFLNSGKTTVKVLGGIVGYIDSTNPDVSMKNELPYGNVFGGSAGEAAPNVADDPSDLYLYSPAFFSGYVNETDVTIGMTEAEFTANKANESYMSKEPYKSYETYANYLSNGAPKILGSVYGGGQDGHVRRDTKVTVLSGEIGKPYDDTNISLLKTDNINDPQWLHRGNVYGGGSGITKYVADIEKMYAAGYTGDKIPASDYSNSSGSVTRFTQVDIKGGTVHRNVYGGGSLGSVGAPNLGQGYEPYKPGQANIDGKPVNGPGRQSLNLVNISGSVGTVVSSRAHYGGDVFGAGRGNPSLNVEQFGTSVWTLVNIFDGANIKGNVFGGGDAGIVKKDTEVRIGYAEEPAVTPTPDPSPDPEP